MEHATLEALPPDAIGTDSERRRVADALAANGPEVVVVCQGCTAQFERPPVEADAELGE